MMFHFLFARKSCFANTYAGKVKVLSLIVVPFLSLALFKSFVRCWARRGIPIGKKCMFRTSENF